MSSESPTGDQENSVPSVNAEMAGEKGDSVPMKTPVQAKYEWYQTESDVVITVFLKNVIKENVNIDFQERNVSVTIKLGQGADYCLELDLAHPVDPTRCSWKVMSTKVELKMRKTEANRWAKLEGEDEPAADAAKYPSSSRNPKNWDEIEKEVVKEEKDQKLDGDAGVQQLFQKIYADSSDEVKKAMMKSYQESAGTCLSTNWEDVKKETVPINPPDCMEYKTYDS